MMVDHLACTEENMERILAVQRLFGALGKPLVKPGRVLVGEGHLLKLCRRRPQPKAFFLFSDVLVYGSVVVPGRWYAHQQVIPLEHVELEDVEDGLEMKNQWLVRTPRKSFYVSAASLEEKRAWMEHIGACRSEWLRHTERPAASRFAAVWVPDRASAICMRCCARFGVTQRRHHCRRCGFMVCASCSKDRFLIPEISPHPVRVCRPCHWGLWQQTANETQTVQRGTYINPAQGHIDGKNCDKEQEQEQAVPVYEPYNDEDRNGDDSKHSCSESGRQNSWSPYIDLQNHLRIANLGNY